MAATVENCDTELRLSLGQSGDVSPAESISSSSGSGVEGPSGPRQQQQQQQQKKKITVFYNGQICVCEVTEVQAKAILSMAWREVDDTTVSKNNNQQQQQQQPAPVAQLSRPSAGLSMKRSLQRFLQKRKSRIGAVSPYNQKKQQQLLLFPINSHQSFPCSWDLNSVAN